MKKARTKGMSIRALACFTWRHLCRFSLRPFLALLAMAGFLAASCWLWNSVQSGEREAERLYLSTVVEAQITTKDSTTVLSGNGGAYIGSRTVQEILDTGFVKDYTLIAGCDGMIGKRDDDPGRYVMFTGIEEVEKSLPKIGEGIQIQYGDGYGPELFVQNALMQTSQGSRQMPLSFFCRTGWQKSWESPLGRRCRLEIAMVLSACPQNWEECTPERTQESWRRCLF